MIHKLRLKRLFLPLAVAVSLLVPGIAASPTFAMSSSMDDMGHSTADIVSCMNQHQVPTATTTKELDQIDSEDENPLPPEAPYFNVSDLAYAEPTKQKTDLIRSSSFRPPDIVILTANLRI